MPKYLPKTSKLTVISDTAMSGISKKIAALEPVVREIEQLSRCFKSVDWLGYRWYSSSPANHKIPSSKNLTMISANSSGGNSFKEKLSILTHLPLYLSKINYLIKNNNIVYTRGPSIPALLVILLSYFNKNKIYLHKYAGGWDLESIPLSYLLQRWLLKKQKRGSVLVSSATLNDLNHIVSLPNPCLEKDEIQAGYLAMKSKIYSNGLRICFVGNCNFYKGIFDVLDTLNILADKNNIANCTIAGLADESELRSHLNQRADRLTAIVGVLSRSDLNEVYAQSHFILLPSISEGFPKVLAEAAAFGCIPVTSKLPGFDKIITNNVNGILLQKINSKKIAEELSVNWSDDKKMRKMANHAHLWSKQFSYSNFLEMINHLLRKK